MLILLSPAKSLDWSPVDPSLPVTEPVLPKDTGVLMRKARRLKPRQLQELMSISPALAELNHDRFQAMSEEPSAEQVRPAALAFNGDVYRGLDAGSLDAEELAFAQEHLAILSGLYGTLRPLDLIQPYRLEMGTSLKTRRGGNLYAFWGDKVTHKLNARILDQPERNVVNLASNEYFRVVNKRKLKGRLVAPVFKEELEDGRLQVISFYAKWARGAMARYAITERITDPEGLKDFDVGGYCFRPELSDDKSWVFSRPKPPPVNG